MRYLVVCSGISIILIYVAFVTTVAYAEPTYEVVSSSSSLSLSQEFPQELYDAYKNKPQGYTPRTKHLGDNGEPIYINELITAHSPYLLQHAHNPVDWKEYTTRSLQLAKEQDKLVFLSIGYATCHWCHVMEHESFEDLEVAHVLNEHYISVKVDREVQTDVDAHFMEVSRILTGIGGWPLNVILTPDGQGFFARTYIPKEDLLSMLRGINTTWQINKSVIHERAQMVQRALQSNSFVQQHIPKNIAKLGITALYELFDELQGGFGDAPKFPRENALLFLINEEFRAFSAEGLEMITTTLNAMSMGGMYDVVGGGFHRYSVDNDWLTPHFEKMLYNQARMSEVYMKAYRLTGNLWFKYIAKRTLDYMLRELKSANGGFYAGTDADSEGKEGTYFTWEPEGLKDIAFRYPKASSYFDMSDSTVFEEHNIIRYKDVTLLTPRALESIAPFIGKLYHHRAQRIPPLLDNKIILSWNALVLRSLLYAGETLDATYTTEAKELLEVLATFRTSEGLKRIKVNDILDTDALFVDYSYLIDAYVRAYNTLGDKQHLQQAEHLVGEAITLFWDEEELLFNMSNNPKVYFQKKEVFDSALPSSNAVMYGVLMRLSNITGDSLYEEYAMNMLSSLSGLLGEVPDNHTTLLEEYQNATKGYIDKVQYLYDGRVVVKRAPGAINISLKDGWHINAHVVNVDGLIPTMLSGQVLDIVYPSYTPYEVGFSEYPILIYKNSTTISFHEVERHTPLTLTLQACSDKVCLPPSTTILY